MLERIIQLTRLVVCLVLAGVFVGPTAWAAVTIYATGATPLPVSNFVDEDTSAGSGYFDIFVNTDVAVVGLALDVFARGNGIELTGMEFPTYGGDRWDEVIPGSVAADGKSIQGGNAYAIAGTGLDPLNLDGGYNSQASAFHFARVNYNRIGPGASSIWLAIGQSDIGVMKDSAIFLGASDEPIAVAGGSAPLAGLHSRLADGVLGVPRPDDIPLLDWPAPVEPPLLPIAPVKPQIPSATPLVIPPLIPQIPSATPPVIPPIVDPVLSEPVDVDPIAAPDDSSTIGSIIPKIDTDVTLPYIFDRPLLHRNFDFLEGVTAIDVAASGELIFVDAVDRGLQFEYSTIYLSEPHILGLRTNRDGSMLYSGAFGQLHATSVAGLIAHEMSISTTAAYDVSSQAAVAPEPSSVILLISMLLGMAVIARRPTLPTKSPTWRNFRQSRGEYTSV